MCSLLFPNSGFIWKYAQRIKVRVMKTFIFDFSFHKHMFQNKCLTKAKNVW